MDPEGQRRPALRVVVGDEDGRGAAPALGRWLTSVAPARARGAVSVALVSDARVRALNRRFRGIDRVTDVLSFPSDAEPQAARRRRRAAIPQPLTPSPQPLAPSPFLGDIVIARGVARRQAREAGHSESTEWRVLALHGLLHLLGYDHERDGGEMRRVEQRLRSKGGLREGLIDRAAAPARSAGRQK
jgi:probable rRNA maturation factor